MSNKDEILYQQTALAMLRRFGMDVRPAPVNINQLARRMGIVLINSSVKSGDIEFLDFQYAPEQMPEGCRKLAGGETNRIIIVKKELMEPEKLILITAMLVFVHVSINKDEHEEEHREKKLTSCVRFTLQDLQTKLAAYRLTALCIIMAPPALAFYFRNRTKSTAEKIIHNIKELDRFCLYFKVGQQDAIDRLSLLQTQDE